MIFLLLTFAAAFTAHKDGRLTALIFFMTGVIAWSMLALEFTEDKYWYQVCAAFEAAIVVGCLIWRTHASIPVMTLSIMAIVWHLSAYTEYASGIYSNDNLGPVVALHHKWIPLIQFGQAASLFLFSPPSLRFIDRLVSAIISRVFRATRRAKQKPEEGTWQPTWNR